MLVNWSVVATKNGFDVEFHKLQYRMDLTYKSRCGTVENMIVLGVICLFWIGTLITIFMKFGVGAALLSLLLAFLSHLYKRIDAHT